MILEIPKNAETILHILEKAGYEAYVVGGCVRDSILGRSPDDWDITTSAKPEQVKALFHRTVDTGLQHGTVTVLMEKEGYEVTEACQRRADSGRACEASDVSSSGLSQGGL